MRQFLLCFLLLINDFLFINLSLFVSLIIKNNFFSNVSNVVPEIVFGEISKYVIFSWILFFFLDSLYRIKKRNLIEYIYLLFKANLSAFFLLITIMYALKISNTVSRIFVFLIPIFSFVFLVLSRLILQKLIMKIVFFKMPTHLLSLEKDYGYFEKNLKEAFSKSNHYKKTSLFKNSDDMVKAIKKINFEVEQVMLVTRSISLRNLYKIINELKGKVYEIKIIPNIKNFEFMDFFLEDQNGHFYLEYKQVIKNPLMDFSKRIFDLIIAIFFIIIFSPIFVIVSLLIRLESGGPIFFKQERIGLNGQVFNVIKFRSMYKNAEERLEKMLRSDSEIKSEYEKFAKLEKDPRITKIGSFIRKYSIDEIPQFFNVLMGDMSLVGPRPYMKSELKKMGWKKRVIINARPGITGLWQISGRSNLTFQERVNLEKYYIESWNLFRDFVILLLTPIAVFKSKGK